jgi:hypothetical protein
MFTLREQVNIMNIPPHPQYERIPQEEQFLLEHALAALQGTTGIVGRIIAIEPDLGTGARPDAVIELAVGELLQQYVVEIKRIDRFAAIGQIKQQLDNFRQPGLLIAPRITTETADKCRELNVQFIDANGNAFLQAPGLFVLTKGQRPRADEAIAGATMGVPRGGTPTALRAMFVLLCRPEMLNAPYREIKQAAGIALGAIGWVFFDLNARGYTTGGKGKGDRRILERQRLLEEWVTNYPIRLRPKLNPKRFHAPDPNWWRQIDITQYDAQWGGEVAADKLTGHLRPNTVTIYMRPEDARRNLTTMVVDNKLRADPKGEIEVLETFWDFPGDETKPDIVPPLLVYADLLATMDPRNHETARMIYEERIRGFDTKA